MKTIVIILVLTIIIACNQPSSNTNGPKIPGFISLGFKTAQSFNPTAEHGKIAQYKLTIAGSGLAEPIINYYSADTKEITFEGLPSESNIRIMIEAINTNGICVRRGKSNDIKILGGQTIAADITVNNVPIFANVRDGAVVYNNRFVPKIFAPGEIPFQISDLFNEQLTTIKDQISDSSTFSISTSDNDSVMPVYVQTLPPGSHKLTVQDDKTGESSTINITVLDGSNKKPLITTAGGYLGSMISINHDHNNLIKLNKRLVEMGK